MTEDFRRFSGTDTYLTSEGLESAVNCAIVLQRPLLVTADTAIIGRPKERVTELLS